MQYEIKHGDCLEVLRDMPENSVDAIVTDPPYGLSFMGKKWDYDVPSVEIWRECLRVLKPGGHLLLFAGTRTQHRMAVNIEDAGFEIRDMIAWVYGSGFPKSADVSKHIDKAAGAEREVVGTKVRKGGDMRSGNLKANDRPDSIESLTIPATEAVRQWQGWGTALKPSLEPITVARKPFRGTVAANVLEWGTGAINIDASRVGTESTGWNGLTADRSGSAWDASGLKKADGIQRKSAGRWPANLIHDGSDEVVGLFPVTGASSGRPRRNTAAAHNAINSMGKFASDWTTFGHDDMGGSASRFFYCAQYDRNDLLFCRAKAILSAWKLTKGENQCSQENASSAESSLSLLRQAAVSVLSDAVIAASRGDKLLSDVKGLSTAVTKSECERLCETLIMAMLSLENGASRAPLQDELTQNGCRVSCAAIQKPTDTMKITISLPTSGGYAEPVTFSIIPSSMAYGAKDLSADRFRYCAKASKRDRDEGCDGMPLRNSYMVENGSKTAAASNGVRYDRTTQQRNHHPTVKPTDLMRYLCRLITPPGGLVLDPFMGSGSTGKAAMLERFQFIGIEREPEYVEIAKARIEAAKAEAESMLL